MPFGVSQRHKEGWAAEFARVAEAGEACIGISILTVFNALNVGCMI